MAPAGVVGQGLPPVPCLHCRTNLNVTMYRGPVDDPELPDNVERELGWCGIHGNIHSRMVLPGGGTLFQPAADARLTLVPRAGSHS